MATFFTGQLGENSTTLGRDARYSGSDGDLKIGRYDFSVANASLTNADTVRCGSINPVYNIWSVTLYVSAMGTSGAIDLGLAKSGVAHDGDVIEVDTFADAYDCSSAVTADIFTAAVGGAGAGIAGVIPIVDQYRGLPLWQLANSTEAVALADGQWDWLITVNNKGTNLFSGTLVVEYSYS